MHGRKRTWTGVVAAVLIVALFSSTAQVAALQPSLPAIPTSNAASSAWLPQGAGVTPLSTAELQSVDGEGWQLLVVGAKLAAKCVRSASCRSTAKRVARTVVKAVRAGFEAAGAYYTARSIQRDLGR